MATARKITDFMSSGTHAARPATPPGLGTGEIAVYYETDTLHMFAYVSGAWVQIDSAGATAASIVQNSSVALASHATGITLAGAPVQGNLLMALVSDITTSPTAGAGWTMIASASAAQDGYGVLYKLAGASEPAAQTPCSDTHSGTITIFEINNGAPGIVTAVPGYTGTAVAESPISSKGSGGLIVGVFVNRTTTGPTSITGTGVAADNTASGSGRFAAAFHITNPVNGANSVTANYATSQGGVFIGISVG